jgi:hypothetical protein
MINVHEEGAACVLMAAYLRRTEDSSSRDRQEAKQAGRWATEELSPKA